MSEEGESSQEDYVSNSTRGGLAELNQRDNVKTNQMEVKIMLLFVRIPGWVYLWLSIFSVAAIITYAECATMGPGSWPSWLPIVIGAIFAIPFLCVAFFVSRRSEKWNEMGLRYAKYATADGMKNHAAKAAKCFLKAAICKNVDSVINLGLCYAEGFGVERNLEKAVKCYRIAAKKDVPDIARLALGFCYVEGIGVEKDMVRAEDLYRKVTWCPVPDRFWNPIEVVMWMRNAAEWGNVVVQVDLAECYLRGTGVEKDEAEAVKWFRKAAEQGDASAQTFLADCYLFGRGVAKDETEALTWFRRAAKQDDYGAETAKNYFKAVEDDDPEAQCDLARDYQYGWRCAKNEVEAVKWYRKAAEQGNADGQVALGNCYYFGTGVEVDEVEAAKWCRKAAEQGNKYARQWCKRFCRSANHEK